MAIAKKTNNRKTKKSKRKALFRKEGGDAKENVTSARKRENAATGILFAKEGKELDLQREYF